MSAFLTDIASIIDDDRLHTGTIDSRYLTDALGHVSGHACAVVFPLTTEEVSALVRTAAAHDAAITARGAGTNLVGSTIPQRNNLILDFTLMNKIVELDEENLTVTVEPGVVLGDLAAWVAERGYFYPPDPGDRSATIGGNVATNAGGMRAVKYGVTRTYVMALEIVTAEGHVITVGSKNRKDATGLDLLDLLVGSEGTLAITTKITLRLIGAPQVAQSLLVPFAEPDAAWAFVPRILRSGANPAALEFMARPVVELGEGFTGVRLGYEHAANYVLLTVDGTQSEVDAATATVAEIAEECGALAADVLSDERSRDVWRLRGSLVRAVEASSAQEPIDVVVPVAKVGEFVTGIADLETETGVQMVAFGHAGDGNVHLCVVRGDRTDQEWDTARQAALDGIYGLAHSLGGLISAEHGVGVHKRHYFARYTDPQLVTFMRGIKAAFDPHNILNPGISYAE